MSLLDRNISSPADSEELEIKLARWLHRLTGLGLFLFLALHILHIWLMSLGPELFNQVTAFLHWSPLRLLHPFLFFCLLFHATNGVRLLVLDLWPVSPPARRRSVYVAAVCFAALFIPGGLLLLMDALLPY